MRIKSARSLLWRAAPRRALVESWLVCLGLLLPVFPVILETTPLARSLYLILLPLLCAVVAGVRMRFFPDSSRALVVLKESGLALLLSAGVMSIIMGLVAGLGQMDAIHYSYAGTTATMVFILMSTPAYLGIRVSSWVWQRWEALQRRRYVWALTHTILMMLGRVGVLVLLGSLLYFFTLLKGDIWQIPPDSPFAQVVFWLTALLLFAFLLVVCGLILFLPPALLFSFQVARAMTARVETLADGTRALRQGDLTSRVTVQGEDEIAQLQADFNSMAADLEKSVQALQGEKDKVWTLLEARRELVAGVSHELRNPVAIIRGYSDSLRRTWKERSPEEVDRDLETIQYETTRLQTILNDLLTTSQAEAGKLSIVLQPVDVTVLARRAVDTFAGLAWGSKRVRVSLSAPEQAAFALADPLRLEQVLINLVQNAVRHTSPGGLVAVEVQVGVEQIGIEVEDTGEGIPAEDLPHIWEKYFQASSPQRQARDGMGLGLALVKELTEAMGGTVSVKSDPGDGSLFRVELPACTEQRL